MVALTEKARWWKIQNRNQELHKYQQPGTVHGNSASTPLTFESFSICCNRKVKIRTSTGVDLKPESLWNRGILKSEREKVSVEVWKWDESKVHRERREKFMWRCSIAYVSSGSIIFNPLQTLQNGEEIYFFLIFFHKCAPFYVANF